MILGSMTPRGDRKLYDPALGGWMCSYYGAMRSLYDDRNAAVHGADVRWVQKMASRHGWHATDMILATLAWVTQQQSSSISDVDAAIAVLPAA